MGIVAIMSSRIPETLRTLFLAGNVQEESYGVKGPQLHLPRCTITKSSTLTTNDVVRHDITPPTKLYVAEDDESDKTIFPKLKTDIAMPIQYRSFSIPTSYASCSIGTNESDTLPFKLQAISQAGFDAIELSMPDILDYGKLLHGRAPDPKDYDSLVEIGKEIKKLATENGLNIMMLQPFANFEGWPKGTPEREDAFDRARGWIRVMEAIETDLLQIGSTDSDPAGITSSFDDMAADLRELADLIAPKGFRIAYENW
ncbi:hypothetical protein V5O48_010958, partial [Marasmius crinis-equi]